MRLFRTANTLLLAALLVLSLSLNVATVAFSSVAYTVAAIYETVTGATSLLRQRDRRIATLSDDVIQRDRRLGELAEEIEVKEKRITGLVDEIGAKERRILGLTDQLASSQVRISSLNDEVAQLSDEVATLKMPRRVNYRGERVLVSEAIEDTTARVSSRTAKGAARNVTSVFAESIPFAGIAVAVGVTAWELNDACENMKDLQELTAALSEVPSVASTANQVCGMDVPSKEEVWERIKSSPRDIWDEVKVYLPDLPELPDVRWPDFGWPDWLPFQD